MKTIRKTAASLIIGSVAGVFSGFAQAQFMYQVTSSDIEGAVMPAVPFASESAMKTSVGSAPEAPASLGLAPASSAGVQGGEATSASGEMPMRKRPLSASETSDLYLR